jgi:hypothetical protein
MIFVGRYDPKKDFEYEKKLRDTLGLEQFNAYKLAQSKNNELWDSYIDQGLIRTEYTYEKVFVPEFDENISVLTKVKTILNPGVSPSQIVIHPELSTLLATFPTELQPEGVETIILE